MRVLFVCSGNVCRSPMAETLFRQAADHAGINELRIASAGTLGLWNLPAAPEAIDALREVGLDLGAHRSRGLVAEEIAATDWIVTMAREHIDYLAQHYVEALPRTRLVRAFEHTEEPLADAPDLADPIGAAIGRYREQRELLFRAVTNLAAHMRRSR